MKKHLLFSVCTYFIHSYHLYGQTGTVCGTVKLESEATEFATVALTNTSTGTVTNMKGEYCIHKIPYGSYALTASYVGYKPITKSITLTADHADLEVNFDLVEKSMALDAVVITGTKTSKRQTNSPVIVNVLSSKIMNDVQACNLSEGLKFQPGLRVETDCQTCNYTQLRMNGLAGGYSQILINGRPIFSPLTGLYGMEQLPVNMIDRIEVVRGGGSSLYGSSAIGGTVNVITKIPKKNSFEIDYNYQNINQQTSDNQWMGNATLVSEDKNSGVSFFFNRRERGFYDHNADNFSEIPMIENSALGASAFFLPSDHQKIALSLSHLNEYRLGGEMVDKPAYLAQQSEERTHNVWMASADYQINFNDNYSSVISYLAWQNTGRKHYTGIIPDEEPVWQKHIEAPPYGSSDVNTLNLGAQLNHRLYEGHVLTLGTEYLLDDVYDEIPSYRYKIDQTTKDFGLFIQSDWNIAPSLTLLSGMRMDIHNLVHSPIISPRASLLYKLKAFTQFRLNYGVGFRAPQAFDTDLHIAFAGGGISRVSLSPDLLPERSQSISGSINFDKPSEHFIAGFTLEGFYTHLKDAFILQPIGEDEFGELFEKQNGQGAKVQGTTLELRANYDFKVQLETGYTIQSSRFNHPVAYIDGVDGIRKFIRTPHQYGFATLSMTPTEKISANINYVYTGTMKIPHFSGAPNQAIDEIIDSDSFSNVSIKLSYTVDIERFHSGLEFYTGAKNIFNQYQEVFDIGKNRDSNFVYGPSQPRTLYIGIKLKSMK